MGRGCCKDHQEASRGRYRTPKRLDVEGDADVVQRRETFQTVWTYMNFRMAHDAENYHCNDGCDLRRSEKEADTEEDTVIPSDTGEDTDDTFDTAEEDEGEEVETPAVRYRPEGTDTTPKKKGLIE